MWTSLTNANASRAFGRRLLAASPSALRTAPAALLLACALASLVAAGCSPRPRTRSLPRHINTVHVPIFDSQAFVSGVEELAAQYTVDAFLRDGRVTPVNRGQADLILEGFLLRYTETTNNLSGDDFELSREAVVLARVFAYAPEDEMRRTPIFVWNNIEAKATLLTDSRLVFETSRDDGKDLLMQLLGAEIVKAVMEGDPAVGPEAEDFDRRLDDPGPRYQPVESLRERRLRRRGMAPLRAAF